VEPGKLRIGKMKPLGRFARTASYANFGMATLLRIEKGSKALEIPIVAVIGFVDAKERLFCIAVYRQLRDEKDVELAKGDAAAWADAIIAANRPAP
jgi:hypothetical protein